MKKIFAWLMAAVLAGFMAGCGSSSSDDSDAPSAPSSAYGYVILAQAGISTVPTSAVTGNMGVSPALATAITGFALTEDASTQFSTSPQVTGEIYAADYATPTPARLTAAVGDMQTRYTDLAGMAPGFNEFNGGDLVGQTLAPGVYHWTTAVALATGNVTLTGSSSAQWIFQIDGALTTGAATEVILAGGAKAKNVYWVVAGGATLGATSIFKGVILSATAITVGNAATITGRLLAQTAVTLDSDVVKKP